MDFEIEKLEISENELISEDIIENIDSALKHNGCGTSRTSLANTGC